MRVVCVSFAAKVQALPMVCMVVSHLFLSKEQSSRPLRKVMYMCVESSLTYIIANYNKITRLNAHFEIFDSPQQITQSK